MGFAWCTNADPLITMILHEGTLLMKLLFLAGCVLLGSGPAWAEWLAVDRIPISRSTVYLNPNTIHREKDLVSMWALFDYEGERHIEGSASLVSSSKNHYEYECTGKRQRLLEHVSLSDRMGTGRIVDRMSNAQPWQPVPPEGPEHSLWTAACTNALETLLPAPAP
jgi:hypothetical protein